MLLESKVVIVTGAAASPRGIDKATAKALAAQGARVAIVDLRNEDAERAARDLGEVLRTLFPLRGCSIGVFM